MNWSEFLSILSILIALATLFINFKNRETNKKNYKINQDYYKRNNMNLVYVESKKFTNEFQVKLAIFNTSSTKLIINCVKVYIEDLNTGNKWKNLDIVWWPSEKDSFSEGRFLREEYKNLLVKDYKNIFIKIDGKMSHKRYKFEVLTSFEQFSHITTITGINTRFAKDYQIIST